MWRDLRPLHTSQWGVGAASPPPHPTGEVRRDFAPPNFPINHCGGPLECDAPRAHALLLGHDDRADLADRVAAVAPDGVDVYWDASGTNDTALAAAVLRPGGRMLVTAARSPVTVELAPLYTRDIVIDGFVISRASAGELAEAAGLINSMLVDGRLTTRIAERLPLDQAARAHQRMESGEVDGRLLLTV